VTSVFLICFVILAALGHGYLWIGIVNWFHAWSGPRKIVDGVTLLCLLAFVLLPIAIILSWKELDLATFDATFNVFQFPIFSRLFSLRSYMLFCALWGAAQWVLGRAYSRASNNPSTLVHWRQEKAGLTAELGNDEFSGAFSKLLGKVPGNQVFQLTIDRKRLAIPDLSPNHVGLKIAHISDLHMTGRIGPRWYEQVAEQVNPLQADVIAVTGDIVEHKDCWPWLANSLGKLRAKHGVYFIMGNHDFYLDTKQTKKRLEAQGLICLSERRIDVEWNGAPVILAGNERPWGPGSVDLSEESNKNSAQLPLRLLLMHTPDQFAWACQQNVSLALAGHTHGGQLRFPLLGPIACPSRYGTRYACGVFRRGKTVMHVTRGISGKTPLRWNCPPEIALLELVRA